MTRRLLAIALLLTPTGAAAQQLSVGPNTLVLGAAADAMLCGVDLLDVNAAGIAEECAPPAARFRMIFPPSVLASWSSDGPHDLLWEYRDEVIDGIEELDFGDIPAADRRAIVDGIPADGWTTGGLVTVPLLAFVKGSFGLSVSKTFQAEGTLPKDVAELLLEGYERGRLDYDPDDFDLSVVGVTRYTVGYARAVRPDWTVGGSASLHTGTVNGYYDAGPVTIDLASETAGFDIIGGLAGGAILDESLFAFRKPDGLGFSLDLGGRYRRGDLTAAVGVENLLSGMWWPERTIVVTTSVIADTEGTVTTETARDTLDASAPAIEGLRDGIEAYTPALRLRTAAAYDLDLATIGLGVVLEPGDGLLYSTGGGWDLGVAFHPWPPLDIQASVGHWRDATRLGAGVTVVLGNFLFQGGLRHSDIGQQVAFSIALAR